MTSKVFLPVYRLALWRRGLLRFGLLVAVVWLAVGSVAAQNPLAPAAAQLPPQARKALYLANFEQYVARLYAKAGLGPTGLSLPVFREGLVGYYNLKASGKGQRKTKLAPVLSLIDFSLPSNKKRLWVINIAQGRVLFNTLVAHGKGTGDVEPVAFSNFGGSNQSSLGFYRTAGGTYQGKHGTSLKIYGLDPGFNTNAANRAVVVHGAEYVCEDFIKQHGHLGRSQGCPALPVAQTKAIVEAIKGNSVMYLHGPAAAAYRSKWLNVDTALEVFAQSQGLVMR